MGIEVIGLLGINLISQFSKKYITPKFGSTGVHVFIFLLAMVWVGLNNLYEHYDLFHQIVSEGIVYLTLSIAMYEVILKRLGINKIM